MTRNKIKKLNLGFNIGDKVTLNTDHVYTSYTQFVNRHRKYAARYQYKQNADNSFIVTVVGVYRHVMAEKYDANKYVAVIQDRYKRIWLVGELGVKPI